MVIELSVVVLRTLVYLILYARYPVVSRIISRGGHLKKTGRREDEGVGIIEIIKEAPAVALSHHNDPSGALDLFYPVGKIIIVDVFTIVQLKGGFTLGKVNVSVTEGPNEQHILRCQGTFQ
jgi:hypothetical protein